jgi:TonB-dependent receptor
LRDVNHDGSADLTFTPNPKSEVQQSFKVGAAAISRSRNSTSRRFTYSFDGTEGIDLTAPIVDVITPENIGEDEPDDPAYLSVHEVTTNSDDYEAGQTLRAGYAMADLGLGKRIRLMGGARVESSRQSVRTFELFNPQLVPVEAVLDTTDVLPALTGTLALGPARERDRMLLRAGYGRTLSRPEFRELSSVAFTDFLTGALLKGNPDLERATIDNLDLRWELYPSPNESLSVAAFYKDFTDPIERVAQSSSVSGLAYTFGNARGATNLGVEMDLRITFGRISDVLRDVYVSANGALIDSQVDLTGSVKDTSTERPLQGQSPWVANLQLGYDNPESGLSLSLLYNSFGPRITDVGQSGVPDTYELPVHRLDAVALVPLSAAWRIRLKATNLLDAKEVSRTGDAIAEESRSGRAFSLAIQWRPPPPERGERSGG